MAANSQGPRKDLLKAKQDKTEQEVAVSQVPEDMTANETEDWVSGDTYRARAALAAEEKREHPRSTVVTSLQRLADNETGAGIATGEA
jgi:hypothetical protein